LIKSSEFIKIEGSLEVKLPTIWTDGKPEVGRIREEKRREEKRGEEKRREEKKKEDQRRERVRRKKMQVREKVRNREVLWLAKAAAEPPVQMRDEKLHAVVVQSTFQRQNVKNALVSDHFYQLRCSKSASSCGTKHVWKSKC